MRKMRVDAQFEFEFEIEFLGVRVIRDSSFIIRH